MATTTSITDTPITTAPVPATLSEDDIEKLFSGAPQYFARSEGHNAGPPHPSVAYPWDEALEIRDLADHAPILDEAWSCATAWPHLTRDRRARERREARRQAKELRRRLRREREQRADGKLKIGVGLGAGAAGERISTTTLTASGAATPTAAGARSPARAGSKRAHFYPRCRERPSMLSMQGLEKGTVGYQAALELGVADALLPNQDPDSDDDDRNDTERQEQRADRKAVVDEARLKLLSAKDGLRRLDEEVVLQGLARNEARYLDGIGVRGSSSTKTLYNELFVGLLHPPTRVLDHADPNGLSVQIRALLKVLAAPDAWVDYSHVDKRMRLGKVLWADLKVEHGEVGEMDQAAKEKAEKAEKERKKRHEERYWLLLQILLACELLVRLDAITEGEELGIESIRPSEVHRFERDCTASVRWSLILARVWLENIEVTKVEAPPLPSTGKDEHASGWLSILAKRMSLTGDHHKHEPHALFAMRGKFGERQVNGLAHFARELRWPDAENYIARISATCRALTERTPMPIPPGPPPLPSSKHESHSHILSSPISPSSATSPSTSGWHWPSHHKTDTSPKRRATPLVPPKPNRRLVLPLQNAGWLSRSYLSGLVMPGEGLSHVMMATLLESDSATDAAAATKKLANLRGGLVHAGKSFWSTSCVVGRVLAAGSGSAECMGWISSEVIPRGWGSNHDVDSKHELKWIDVEAAKAPEGSEDELQQAIGASSTVYGGLGRRRSNDWNAASYEKKARLWAKAAIERESSVLGDADPAAVSPADFIIPHETAYADPAPKHVGIEMLGLQLAEEGKGSGDVKSGADIESYAASISFAVTKDDSHDGDGDYEDRTTREHTFALRHDVRFATAHPCAPSRHVKIIQSPSSPTIQQIDVGGIGVEQSFSSISSSGMGTGMGRTVYITGHPLHKYYTYTAIHLTHLLSRPDLTLEQHLSASSTTSPTYTKVDDPRATTSPKLPHSKHHKHHHHPSTALNTPRLLVVDCITGFRPQPPSHEVPLSPIASRDPAGRPPSANPAQSLSRSFSSLSSTTPSSLGEHPAFFPQDSPDHAGGIRIDTNATHSRSYGTSNGSPTMLRRQSTLDSDSEPEEVSCRRMHHETRRRRFGSDMEVLARALCAERGWNAVVSRRRRGCLACAMREAGGLGWRVVLRVD